MTASMASSAWAGRSPASPAPHLHRPRRWVGDHHGRRSARGWRHRLRPFDLRARSSGPRTCRARDRWSQSETASIAGTPRRASASRWSIRSLGDASRAFFSRSSSDSSGMLMSRRPHGSPPLVPSCDKSSQTGSTPTRSRVSNKEDRTRFPHPASPTSSSISGRCDSSVSRSSVTDAPARFPLQVGGHGVCERLDPATVHLDVVGDADIGAVEV